MENYPSEVNILDLTGFRRRFPARLLRWHVGQLHEGEQAMVAISGDLDAARFQVELSQCGAAVVDERVGNGQHLYTVCKGDGWAAEELDVRGLRCPFPVIEARRRMQRLAPHRKLRLITDCTAAAGEIETWTARNPQVVLLGTWQERGSEHYFLLASQRDGVSRHA